MIGLKKEWEGDIAEPPLDLETEGLANFPWMIALRTGLAVVQRAIVGRDSQNRLVVVKMESHGLGLMFPQVLR